VTDPYRMRCGFAYRSVAGLAAKTTPTAIDEGRRQLRRAGCTGGPGLTDPDRIGFRAENDRSAALWGGPFTCGAVELTLLIGQSANEEFALQVGAKLPGPAGTTVSREELDGVKAFADAKQAGHAYVLVTDIGGDYYVKPRETN